MAVVVRAMITISVNSSVENSPSSRPTSRIDQLGEFRGVDQHGQIPRHAMRDAGGPGAAVPAANLPPTATSITAPSTAGRTGPTSVGRTPSPAIRRTPAAAASLARLSQSRVSSAAGRAGHHGTEQDAPNTDGRPNQRGGRSEQHRPAEHASG